MLGGLVGLLCAHFGMEGFMSVMRSLHRLIVQYLLEIRPLMLGVKREFMPLCSFRLLTTNKVIEG